ncbi:MAG TPA: ATP-binding protein [Thermoanaerobaculia bacterium]|jgi:anti-sigma regulatory factor (Ser/Thr protein kinase)|nr:ATP-binding protein [Thermoanaerobaculia bacterium]
MLAEPLAMDGKEFPIRGRGDVVVVSSQAGRLARGFGLPSRRAKELAIVVSELASNIVKHGVRGEIVLTFHPSHGEITVEARDVGPPIRDLQLAMTDGCDDRGPIDPALILRRGGLGTGLGAVVRLADQVDYREETGGKTITARFRLP